jgi:protein required for attachment to host cells
LEDNDQTGADVNFLLPMPTKAEIRREKKHSEKNDVKKQQNIKADHKQNVKHQNLYPH